jgi:hypothetical protein
MKRGGGSSREPVFAGFSSNCVLPPSPTEVLQAGAVLRGGVFVKDSNIPAHPVNMAKPPLTKCPTLLQGTNTFKFGSAGAIAPIVLAVVFVSGVSSFVAAALAFAAASSESRAMAII